MYYWFWDATYILVIIGALICALASWNVNRTMKNLSNVGNANGLTAEQCAQKILHRSGIYDVRIEMTKGNLTDHYSPNEKVLRLSETVYGSTSVAALGVAAHECGHAIQQDTEYFPLIFRNLAVPAANIGSKLSWPIILVGLLLGFPQVAKAGVLLFAIVVIFQLITLPVEFNASRRALTILNETYMLSEDELKGASKVLRAAALTYVASLFASVLQLLRLIIITGGSGRRRR